MSQKLTYSLPIVWDPDTEGNTAKVIATSSQEVTALKAVSAKGVAGLIFLYDSGTANATDLRWVMDIPSGSPDIQTFSYPLVFKKGIYAVMEQGQNQRIILSVAIIDDQV